MNVVFVFQLFCFFLSILIITRWVNRLLNLTHLFSYQYLPCMAWGWFIYFIIYFFAVLIGTSVAAVHHIFVVLSLGVPGIAAVQLFINFFQHRQLITLPKQFPFDKGTWILVFGFVGIMMYVGVYLEFPSDPLAHLKNIQFWGNATQLQTSGNSIFTTTYRFIYFLYHWLLQETNIIEGDRSGIIVI